MAKLDRKWLLFVARLFVGVVFVYSGFLKLLEPIENFRGVIAEYQIIPYAWVGLSAAVIPWLELIFGVFLIIGFLPRLSAGVAGVLSLSFLSLILLSYFKLGVMPEHCGCFGKEGIQLTPYQVIGLDLINMVLCLQLFREKDPLWSLSSALSQEKPS